MRRRLLIALTVFAAMAVFAFAVPLSLTYATSRTQELVLGRNGDADRFATLADAAVADGDSRALAEEIGRYHELYGENVLVVDARGATTVNAGVRVGDTDIAAAVAAARRNQRPDPVQRLTPWSAPTMLVARPVGTGVQVNGAVVIEASTARARSDIATAWAVIAAGAIVAMVVFTLLALTLSRWVLRPLAALSAAVAELTATLPKPRAAAARTAPASGAPRRRSEGERTGPGSLADHPGGVSASHSEGAPTGPVATAGQPGGAPARSDGADLIADDSGGAPEMRSEGVRTGPVSIARRYGGPPEMRAVAESFDAMALAVADSADAQRQLVADTAHAMRNPLAALTIRLDSLEPAIPESATSTFRGASAEVERLTALLDGLLALAVAETPAAFAAEDTENHCDAVQVVADRADAWHSAYEAAGLELRTEPAADHADTAVSADVLAQILDVPLSNSCRYAGLGARTVITVTAEPDWITITIRDNGAGVAPTEIDQLTTRFFRGATAAPGGSGLGLPIAAALTQSRGGTLHIESVSPQGLSVTMRFPAAGRS
ncbi:HAMP domain-containing sensor histidine kinase [Nocardia sp. NPDC050710]|uniref:sensor histidine kinase n=1 Tax=Nocardia sp. NPDC050710 TaxID=3157220 RepID=UPI0033CF7820